MDHPSHGRRRATRTTRALVGVSVTATAGLSAFVFAGTHASATADAGTTAVPPTPAPAAAPPTAGGAVTAGPRTAGPSTRTAAPAPLVAPTQQAAPTHATSGGS